LPQLLNDDRRLCKGHRGYLVTVVVGWDKGAVPEPTATDHVLGFLASNWPLALPIPIFLAMFALWRRLGRDPEELPIAVQYEPPAGFTPAEAGTLMDHRVDMRDITATIVDLAVGGHLTIEDREETALFGLIRTHEYLFHRQESAAGARELEPHERRVLTGIFESGDHTVSLSDLKNKFYQHLDDIRSSVFDRLIRLGYLRSRPDRVQQGWIGAGVALGAITMAGAIVGPARFNLAPLPVMIGVVALATFFGFNFSDHTHELAWEFGEGGPHPVVAGRRGVAFVED
jgi:hypothetical protein